MAKKNDGIDPLIKFEMIKEALNESTANLQGIPYTILLEEGLTSHYDCVGQIRYYEQTIAVEPCLPPYEFFSTILHEFIEFVNKKFELDLEHSTIQSFETALFQALVDNPWYMRAILETLYESNPKTKSKEKAKVSEKASVIPLERALLGKRWEKMRHMRDD